MIISLYKFLSNNSNYLFSALFTLYCNSLFAQPEMAEETAVVRINKSFDLNETRSSIAYSLGIKKPGTPVLSIANNDLGLWSIKIEILETVQNNILLIEDNYLATGIDYAIEEFDSLLVLAFESNRQNCSMKVLGSEGEVLNEKETSCAVLDISGTSIRDRKKLEMDINYLIEALNLRNMMVINQRSLKYLTGSEVEMFFYEKKYEGESIRGFMLSVTKETIESEYFIHLNDNFSVQLNSSLDELSFSGNISQENSEGQLVQLNDIAFSLNSSLLKDTPLLDPLNNLIMSLERISKQPFYIQE